MIWKFWEKLNRNSWVKSETVSNAYSVCQINGINDSNWIINYDPNWTIKAESTGYSCSRIKIIKLSQIDPEIMSQVESENSGQIGIAKSNLICKADSNHGGTYSKIWYKWRCDVYKSTVLAAIIFWWKWQRRIFRHSVDLNRVWSRFHVSGS